MSDTSKTEPTKKPERPAILAFDEMLKAKLPTRTFDIVDGDDKEAFISLNGKPRRNVYDERTFIISDGGTASIHGFNNKRTVDMV